MKVDNELTVNLHIHLHEDGKVLKKLDDILKRLEKPMAESPEVAAFRARVETATTNIAGDITRLLARATGLSEEDKAAFEKIASDLENVASVVPEDGEPSPESRKR